jgi:organic radical activating enzyme
VSLTGGEPLLYLHFLAPLLLRLKAQGFRTYLETNGILWRALGEVIGWCDLIAMDLKPASVTKERSLLSEHRKFLEIAKTKGMFIKMIVSRELNVSEFQELVGLVRDIAPSTPVILQPISKSDSEGHEDPELMSFLAELQRMALRMIPDVRVTPRLHRILKIR